MPYRQSVSTSSSSKKSGSPTKAGRNPKTLSPTVRQAARASQMNRRNPPTSSKGSKGKGKKKKKEKIIGHRMERQAPPGGKTTINLGGYGEEAASSSTDSPSSMDVHVPRYSTGDRDVQHSNRKAAPKVSKLPLRPKTSAPTRNINFGGAGHEYSSYNPYKTSGNVITIDDLPTEGLMITTPRGLPLKECVNATRREMENAAARFKTSDRTRVGGNAARSARHIRNQTANNASEANDGQLTSRVNEFGSGARRLQPPGGKSTFKF